MKRLFFIILLLTGTIFAQNPIDPAAINDTLLNRWIPQGSAGLNLSQIALSEWSQGGENSISWIINGNFGLSYYTKTYSFLNHLKLAYGQTKLGGQGTRTLDNELYLENLYSYYVGWAVEPYISNNIRTAIATGYNYKDLTAEKIADFFDPGYVTQSIGFAYTQNKNITTRIGIGFQEIFTNHYRQYSDDPATLDKTEAFKFETGIESVTEAALDLGGNLLYTSNLRLFTRFKNLDVWDVRWDNTIAAQVNKFLSVKLNVLTLYDRTQSPKTQLKEALLIGVTFVLF